MKKYIIPAIVGAVCLLVGIFIGDSLAINRVKKNISNAVNVSSDTSTKKESTKKEQPKQEPKIIDVGTVQKSGDWDIKVLESKESSEINTGNSGGSIKTTDKFIIVKLELKNMSNAKVEYSYDNFTLLHSNKSSYESHMDSASKLNSDEKIYKKNNSFIGVYDDVNPGTTKNTYISFEVPKDLSIEDFILVNNKSLNDELIAFKLK